MKFDDKQNCVGESLLARVKKVASEHPETRSHLIPLIKQHVTASNINEPLLKKHMGVTLAYSDAWDDPLYDSDFAAMVAKKYKRPSPVGHDFNIQHRVFPQGLRDLQYKSTSPMSVKEFLVLFSMICPGYNSFNVKKAAQWLSKFSGIKIYANREYSVGIYVDGPDEVLAEMAQLSIKSTPADADDAYIEKSGPNKGQFRMWWD